MNKKRISERLHKIHKEWVDSITDEKVRELAKCNTIITGGAITSLLLNEEPKDYDIYFTNKETTLAVAKYYVEMVKKENPNTIKVIDGHRYFDQLDQYPNFEDIDLEKYWWFNEDVYNMTKDRVRIFIKSSGVLRYPEIKKKKKDKQKVFKPVFISSNAITLSNKIQLINRFYGDPSEIHKTFDFLHTFNYWLPQGGIGKGKLVLNVDSLECILDKRLVYRGSKYPLCSVVRMRKFLERGWFINAGQILKMCFQISELDLSNIEVLEDQLIGVDSAHFSDLIGRIQSEINSQTGKDFNIDGAVIAKLVDEIFG